MQLPSKLAKELRERQCSTVLENEQWTLKGSVLRLPRSLCEELIRLGIQDVPYSSPVKANASDPAPVEAALIDCLLKPFAAFLEAAQQNCLPIGVVRFSAWETTDDLNRAVRLAASHLRQESESDSPYRRGLVKARLEQLRRMAVAASFPL